MKPLDTPCRHTDPKPGSANPEADIVACGARAGEQCLWVRGGIRVYPNAVHDLYDVFHPERMEDAAAMMAPSADNPSVEEFDAAVARRDVSTSMYLT